MTSVLWIFTYEILNFKKIKVGHFKDKKCKKLVSFLNFIVGLHFKKIIE